MDIESVLSKLSKILYGRNYQVFLQRYQLPYLPGAGVETYIAETLGPTAEVGGSCPVTGDEVLAAIKASLLHTGDEGYGPRPTALSSEKFNELLKSVLLYAEQTLTSATVIERFWLKEGHPAYPVYWDFAFVFAGPAGVEIFIGSSSD